MLYNQSGNNRNPPLFPSSLLTRLIFLRISENVLKNGLILLKNDCRNGEVPLQSLSSLSELGWKICHVFPLLHLVKKLNQAANTKWVRSDRPFVSPAEINSTFSTKVQFLLPKLLMKWWHCKHDNELRASPSHGSAQTACEIFLDPGLITT